MCYGRNYLMSNPLNNYQEYFREIEAKMEALRAAVLAKEEASMRPPKALPRGLKNAKDSRFLLIDPFTGGANQKITHPAA